GEQDGPVAAEDRPVGGRGDDGDLDLDPHVVRDVFRRVAPDHDRLRAALPADTHQHLVRAEHLQHLRPGEGAAAADLQVGRLEGAALRGDDRVGHALELPAHQDVAFGALGVQLVVLVGRVTHGGQDGDGGGEQEAVHATSVVRVRLFE